MIWAPEVSRAADSPVSPRASNVSTKSPVGVSVVQGFSPAVPVVVQGGVVVQGFSPAVPVVVQGGVAVRAGGDVTAQLSRRRVEHLE